MESPFRKEAVDAVLSAEEGLDLRPDRRWLLVASLSVLLVGTVAVLVPFEQVVEATGVVRVEGHEWLLRASSAGVIQEIDCRVGQQVVTGLELVRMTNPEVEAAVVRAQLQERRGVGSGFRQMEIVVASVRDRIRVQKEFAAGSKARVARAQELVRAQQRLFSEGLAARTAVMSAENELDEARAQVLRNQQQVEALHADLAEVERRLEEARTEPREAQEALRAQREAMSLRAPAEGVVEWIGVFPGQAVSPGDALVRVTPMRAILRVEAFVPVEDSGKLAIGQDAAIALHGYEPRTWGWGSARLTAIGRDLVPGREIQEVVPAAVAGAWFRIRLQPTSWNRLKPEPGQPVRVRIPVQRRSLFQRALDAVSR